MTRISNMLTYQSCSPSVHNGQTIFSHVWWSLNRGLTMCFSNKDVDELKSTGCAYGDSYESQYT